MLRVMVRPGIVAIVPGMTEHIYRLALTMGYVDVTRALTSLCSRVSLGPHHIS